MPNPFIFQASQVLVAVAFAVFISDFRMKKDMIPLVKEKLTLLLKISCLPPLLIYAYALVTLQWVTPVDLFALSLTILGMLFVSKAKLDLSKHHTWAGYCLKSSTLFSKGIYAYIRHPLYTGVYSFIFGVLLTVMLHTNWFLTIAAGIPLIYVMIFLAHSATKETKMLSEKLGANFLSYKRQVHFCLPLRKFDEPP